MMVDLDWCTLHPYSSLALHSLLAKVGSALIGVNLFGRVKTLNDDPSYFLLVSKLVIEALPLPNQVLHVRKFIKVLTDERLGEPFIEDKAMVILVETILVNAHESEELWVYHLFGL